MNRRDMLKTAAVACVGGPLVAVSSTAPIDVIVFNGGTFEWSEYTTSWTYCDKDKLVSSMQKAAGKTVFKMDEYRGDSA